MSWSNLNICAVIELYSNELSVPTLGYITITCKIEMQQCMRNKCCKTVDTDRFSKINDELWRNKATEKQLVGSRHVKSNEKSSQGDTHCSPSGARKGCVPRPPPPLNSCPPSKPKTPAHLQLKGSEVLQRPLPTNSSQSVRHSTQTTLLHPNNPEVNLCETSSVQTHTHTFQWLKVGDRSGEERKS